MIEVRVAKPRKRSAPVPAPFRSRFDVVAIGASAGGLNALTATLHSLPHDFPGSIVIVQHLSPQHKSHLPELLGHATRLHVKQAEHGDVLLPGWIYVAPPDEHLLVGPGKLQLAHSQLVHFTRPSIDLLFESVAGTYGSRSIGVVLSGSGHDGASGIQAIKESGGVTIVQKRAEFGSMPEAALATNSVDRILLAEEIGPELVDLCTGNGIR